MYRIVLFGGCQRRRAAGVRPVVEIWMLEEREENGAVLGWRSSRDTGHKGLMTGVMRARRFDCCITRLGMYNNDRVKGVDGDAV